MKYIRTKDRIYDLSNKYSQTPEEVQIALMTGNYKQSDTIEELCDEFVIDEVHYIESSLKEIVLYEKCIGKGLLTNIYGAIWTSKGLIYVAKMNDKGELELI